MDVVPQSVSPQIQRVLKSFQTSANRTLQGPGGGRLVLLANHNEIQEMAKLSSDDYGKVMKGKSKELNQINFLQSHFPVQKMPVFIHADCSSSEKTETYLEGQKISCFVVGGEKRLCMPQILSSVLRDFEAADIHTVCDNLRIFCSQCQPEQLDILKVSGILPRSTSSCGLITKTDAERLCNALLNVSKDSSPSHPSPNTFCVYHECFGKCKGNFNPEAYTSPKAACIECVDCGKWFTVQKFVCHSHRALENQICHWGFDSENWRHYLLLAKHQHGIEKLQDVLENIKGRFDSTNNYKRKQGADVTGEIVKRCKSEITLSSETWTSESGSSQQAMASAFQAWSSCGTSSTKGGRVLPAPPAIMRERFLGSAPSYLYSGPPVLLHPDKVVPHSDSNRYEPNYAPNVSLAPFQKCIGEDDEDEEDDETKEVTPQMPEPSKLYTEWDLSESDDSSADQMSPRAQGQESGLSPTTENQRALEIELEMIRQALDGKIGNEKEEKDQFVREFCKLRLKHEELLNRTIQAQKTLKQELATVKLNKREKIQELLMKNRCMEKELNKLRQESESKLKEVTADNSRLLKDVKILQERDLESGKLMQINQELQAGLQHYEIVFDQIRIENNIMKDRLLQLGVDAVDLVKANCNGSLMMMRSPVGSPAQKTTPHRSPTERGQAMMDAYHVVSGQSNQQSHAMMECYVKKERDHSS